MAAGIVVEERIDQRSHRDLVNQKGPCNSYLQGPFVCPIVPNRPGACRPAADHARVNAFRTIANCQRHVLG